MLFLTKKCFWCFFSFWIGPLLVGQDSDELAQRQALEGIAQAQPRVHHRVDDRQRRVRVVQRKREPRQQRRVQEEAQHAADPRGRGERPPPGRQHGHEEEGGRGLGGPREERVRGWPLAREPAGHGDGRHQGRVPKPEAVVGEERGNHPPLPGQCGPEGPDDAARRRDHGHHDGPARAEEPRVARLKGVEELAQDPNVC